MKTDGYAFERGIESLTGQDKQFCQYAAAWCFYMNDTVTLPILQQPLTEAAHVASLQQCTQYALCIHDWSRLAFKYANKRDTYAMTHQHDVGYDLQSSLLVSDRDGQPLAPVVQRLVSRDGSYCTYEAAASGHVREHLDEVTHCIHTLEQ